MGLDSLCQASGEDREQANAMPIGKRTLLIASLSNKLLHKFPASLRSLVGQDEVADLVMHLVGVSCVDSRGYVVEQWAAAALCFRAWRVCTSKRAGS